MGLKSASTPLRYNPENIHEPYFTRLSIMVFSPIAAKGRHFERNFIWLYLKGVLTNLTQIVNTYSMGKAFFVVLTGVCV